MQLRRVAVPLPLILASLALTAGCVSVRPGGPPQPARPAPAADRTTTGAESAVEALPLGRLPASEPPSAAPEEPEPEPPAPPAEHRSPRRPGDRTPAGAAHTVHPAPGARPRQRPPVRPKPRPAPPRPYDMTSLCEAAKGTISPSIVALCH
ncbi:MULTISPECIES: hypothetical protein [unclassified Streptomyces]|uniref:hypothetical protein n=1 Tax=unclassified Streptomyces TaxID=2593676 RepID=UPI002E1157C1|nr:MULTISPECIES: hypothetical protein [unclassified Streptomyces]WSR24496.1 hypothetical protein OG573_39080 [Streptomyces sp. NBC_01205]